MDYRGALLNNLRVPRAVNNAVAPKTEPVSDSQQIPASVHTTTAVDHPATDAGPEDAEQHIHKSTAWDDPEAITRLSIKSDTKPDPPKATDAQLAKAMRTPLHVGNGVFSSVRAKRDINGLIIGYKHSEWRWASLAPYSGYKKLYGERKYAKNLPAKPTTTSFLDLYPEVRNQIYRELLVLAEPIELLPLTSQQSRKGPGRVRNQLHKNYIYNIQPLLRLLRTCKQVHEEGAGIFYGENEFRFSGDPGLRFFRAFMHTIGEKNAARLTNVVLPIHLPGNHTEKHRYQCYHPYDFDVYRYLEQRGLRCPEDMDYRTPEDVVLRDVCRRFEESSNLQSLKLILPGESFQVDNLIPLPLQMDKFPEQNGLKVTLLHLFSWYHPNRVHQSQRPLRKTVTTSRGWKLSVKVLEEYEDVEAYAKANAWAYEIVGLGAMGDWYVVNRTEADED